MPAFPTDIEQLCNLYAVGRLKAHELPGIAETLISEGWDTPSLRALLVLESPYSEDAGRLFEAAVSELGLVIPARDEAAIALARETAREIASGGIGEYEGAMKIWKEVVDYIEPVPARLWAFKSNASIIEDCMTDAGLRGSDHTALIERSKKEIMEAAIILAGGLPKTIKELRDRITAAVSECLRGMGFTQETGPVFYRRRKRAVQVVEVCFLDRHQASRLGSNTASFGINLGVYYAFLASDRERAQIPGRFPPREYECHYRRCLLRDIEQEAPNAGRPYDSETEDAIKETAHWLGSFLRERHGRDIIAPGSMDTDAGRRDTWWVDKSGSNIDEVAHSAVRVARKDAADWLDRFSRPGYAIWHTLFMEDGNSWDGETFGQGRRWSPLRKAMLLRFTHMFFKGRWGGDT